MSYTSLTFQNTKGLISTQLQIIDPISSKFSRFLPFEKRVIKAEQKE